MPKIIPPGIMELRKRFHTIMAERETHFVKLRPLRAQQKAVRDKIAALDASETPIGDKIKVVEAELLPLQEEMSRIHRALATLDPRGEGKASVGLPPDGREAA